MNKATLRSRRMLDRALFLLTLGLTALCAQADDLESSLPKRGLQVVCLPQRPVVQAGEGVTLRTWVADTTGRTTGEPLHYVWSVSRGTITEGATPTWSISKGAGSADRAGRVTAKLVVRADKWEASCELAVYVEKAENRVPSDTRAEDDTRGILSGRTLLSPNEKEPPGFGLYSYLLFQSPPETETERERYLRAIESYLLTIDPIEKLTRYRRISTLNLTLLPVERAVTLPDNLSDPKRAAEAAERLLAVYDYSRAKVVLDALGRRGLRSGPYLVSRAPAGASEEFSPLYLDMSRVAPKLVRDWVEAFCELAAQESKWSDVAITRFALNMRNVIAVTSQQTPKVLGALGEIVQVLEVRR